MKSFSKKAILKAAATLQNFLDSNPVEILFELGPSVKDAVEAQGIPHTAIFKVEINGSVKSLDHNLSDGDYITTYPFESVSASDFDPIFSTPTLFIGDLHLGKLVKTLRLLGFDTAYNTNWDDDEIIHRSNNEKRMILTRDLGLLKNGYTQYGYWVRSIDPNEQIHELFKRFELTNNINPFSRCMKCNGRLQQSNKKEVGNAVPPKVKKWHSNFWVCQNCEQIYWQGSHYKRLQEKINALTSR